MKTYLNEGGNVRATNKRDGSTIDAEKIPVKQIGRSKFIKVFVAIFKQMNKDFKKRYNKPIWVDESILANGFAFNGSTSYIMNPEYSDEEVVKYKSSAGDLDIALPVELKEEMWEYLDSIEGKYIIPGAKYMGSNKHTPSAIGDQINSVILVEFDGLRVPAQVDFEFLEFEDNLPTEWAKFSHSSSFDDAKASIKAVNHKYLIRSLVGGASVRKDIVIATGKSTPEKIVLTKAKQHQIPKMLKFSVGRGIRVAYEPMLDHDGNDIFADGKQVYKEIPSKSSSYETVVANIYKLSFGQLEGHESDVKLFNSFVGVLELMSKYLDKSQIAATHDRYLELLWGLKPQRAQELEVNDPELDYQVKSGGYQRFIKELRIKDKSKSLVEAYYKEYGQRRTRESFRSLIGYE